MNKNQSDTAFSISGVYRIFIRQKRQTLILNRQIKDKELYFISRQLYVSTASGMDILSSINIVKENCNKKLYKTLDQVYRNVCGGMTLKDALITTNIFPYFFISMVAVGEKTGKLDDIFNDLSKHYYNKYRTKKSIKQATSYPLFVFMMSILLMYILITNVFPKLINILNQFPNIKIPMYTKILIDISIFMKNYFPFILIGILSLIFIFRIKKVNDYIKLKLPILRRIYIFRIISVFFGGLYILIKSGIPILNCLEISKGMMDNKIIQNKIDEMINSLEKGNLLSRAIEKVEFFPKMLVNLIKNAEETGKLEEVLKGISEFYSSEFEDYLKTSISFIEPTLIIFLSIIIGFIIFAFILPIFKIYRSII